MKTAGSVIYANRHYLKFYKDKAPERLFPIDKGNYTILPDVYIDSTAKVDPTAVVIFCIEFC